MRAVEKKVEGPDFDLVTTECRSEIPPGLTHARHIVNGLWHTDLIRCLSMQNRSPTRDHEEQAELARFP